MAISKTGNFLGMAGRALGSVFSPTVGNAMMVGMGVYDVSSGNSSVGEAIGGIAGWYPGAALARKGVSRLMSAGFKGRHPRIAGAAGTVGDMAGGLAGSIGGAMLGDNLVPWRREKKTVGAPLAAWDFENQRSLPQGDHMNKVAMEKFASQVKEAEVRGCMAAFIDAGLVKVAGQAAFDELCGVVADKIQGDYDIQKVAEVTEAVLGSVVN